MRDLHNKISYLQGLVEGLDLDTASKEGRIISNIIEILDDMAQAIQNLSDNQLELEDYVETIDEDLSELEDDFYEDEEDEEDEEDLDEEYVEMECPKCHDLVYFEADLLDDDDIVEISCPNCDEVVFRTDEDDEDDEDDEE